MISGPVDWEDKEGYEGMLKTTYYADMYRIESWLLEQRVESWLR
jgi:hypothetical protein